MCLANGNCLSFSPQLSKRQWLRRWKYRVGSMTLEYVNHFAMRHHLIVLDVRWNFRPTTYFLTRAAGSTSVLA